VSTLTLVLSRRKILSALVSLSVLAGSTIGCLAAGIEKGAVMEVKPNSIWFQDRAQLTHWQSLKKSRRRAALASYQEKVLRSRDAWQFLNQLTVSVLGYEPAAEQVNVEMKTEGRMLGTKWWLDAHALVQ